MPPSSCQIRFAHSAKKGIVGIKVHSFFSRCLPGDNLSGWHSGSSISRFQKKGQKGGIMSSPFELGLFIAGIIYCGWVLGEAIAIWWLGDEYEFPW